MQIRSELYFLRVRANLSGVLIFGTLERSQEYVVYARQARTLVPSTRLVLLPVSLKFASRVFRTKKDGADVSEK